jgi:hypothetical protein
MSEPIGNSEQLPVALVKINISGHITLVFKNNKTLYDFIDKSFYIYPQRELTDEEIYECHDKTNTNNWVIDFARAIIKASKGEK